jgi:antitoxin (DNA-binding transcriptional repressor) of toxin-antitoxin stability system
MRREGTAMQTVTLSEAAVAVLRFEIRGWKAKRKGARLAAYRELAAAGIMEPVPGTEADYRFTDEGYARREEILREEEDRIERQRFEPPDAGNLSESARGLLRRLASGERVAVTDENRPAFRELAAARILYPVSTWAGGPEAVFRFTLLGWERREEWITAHAAARPL